ncbi:hypothetical protein EHF33_19820 (plasmid) [Deinococcus psychrotolerans]|uniref:AAA+ ATPase domain-containing protein n=1 Tax=Deinococcus psychrotolerans TaxID=2489213 RepID=A0A3G8YJU2_9DEIO|nr:hypothetical protein [Deinococcus psychrotolerans]AZI45165.1 hypothetical protein EHF33_19820 [Deinococcus psychrotolerans]
MAQSIQIKSGAGNLKDTFRAVVLQQVQNNEISIKGEGNKSGLAFVLGGARFEIGDIVKVERGKGKWIVQDKPLPFHEITTIDHPTEKGLSGEPILRENRGDAFRIGNRRFYENLNDAAQDVSVWIFKDVIAETNYICQILQDGPQISGVQLSSKALKMLGGLGANLGELEKATETYKQSKKDADDAIDRTLQRQSEIDSQLKDDESRLENVRSQLDHWESVRKELPEKEKELGKINQALESHLERLHQREQATGDQRAVLRCLIPFDDEAEALKIAGQKLAGRVDESQLLSVHLALKHAPFTVLTGPSGAGKTSLLLEYATALGIHVTPVAVQPNWTGVQNLHGYADPLGGAHYRETPFSAALQAQVEYADANDLKAPLDLILLDEINLSFVEYFLADYLSAFETGQRYIQLATRNEVEQQLQGETYAWLRRGHGRISVPRSLLIAGTANEDHTTRSFSDKFRDRSAFLYVPPPNIEIALKSDKSQSENTHFVPRSAWERWQAAPRIIESQRRAIQNLAEAISALKLPFSVRTFKRALHVYADAEHLGQNAADALDLALSMTVAPKYAALLSGRQQEEQRTKFKELLHSNLRTLEVLTGLWPQTPKN